MYLFAPKEQQIEGLKSTLSQVSFDTFLLAIERLTAAEMMSKSHKSRMIKQARHILGISYEEYLRHKRLVPHCRKEDWKLDGLDEQSGGWRM